MSLRNSARSSGRSSNLLRLNDDCAFVARVHAGENGVSPSLLSRLGNGLKPDTDGFATIIAWLRLPAEEFFAHEGQRDANDNPEPDLMAQLAPLLRARKDLSETDVRYLQQVIGATIERARAQE
ncbi:hypothetical protein SAMN04489806_2663 [Paramicrobacterium humi]|uniref:Uncharacterized protein n=1 Tax=Paramicrobacterium humi TaxID=640635 RepID=A0A1H4PZH8_9MICO|nr:transcriptional regulator [Microbacterium humi]SEC12721.1 hypothetical protein SAMN04489806_2663 [Microbacterium humi]